MKTILDIGKIQTAADASVLVVESGHYHSAFSIFNPADESFGRTVVLQHEAWEAEDNLAHLISLAGGAHYASVVWASAFPEALVVPAQENYSGALAATVYDRPGYVNLEDQVAGWQVTVNYLVPASARQLIDRKFPGAISRHYYTSVLQQVTPGAEQDSFHLRFMGSVFSIIAIKSGGLQLVQSYRYATPLDVVYFLLKICYEFGIDQGEVQLKLSGLIEKDSALYGELHQYFRHLDFADTQAGIEGESSLPGYYFQPFHQLALCASSVAG